MDSVNALDVKEESVGLSIEDIEQMRSDRKQLGKILQLEEISWRQKSRALRLREGDRNTKFSHRITNLRRKFNFISAMIVDRICIETIDNMKRSIHGFFRELFTENEPWRPKVDGLSLPSLPDAAREVLEMQFDEEEITKALLLWSVGIGHQAQMAWLWLSFKQIGIQCEELC